MALYPYRGKPGRFLDSETNKMVFFAEDRNGVHYFPCDKCKKMVKVHDLVLDPKDGSAFCTECATKRLS